MEGAWDQCPAPLFFYGGVMISFFTACCSLFTDTFNAALTVEFFRFLAGTIALGVCYGMFLLFYRGSKRL